MLWSSRILPAEMKKLIAEYLYAVHKQIQFAQSECSKQPRQLFSLWETRKRLQVHIDTDNMFTVLINWLNETACLD